MKVGIRLSAALIITAAMWFVNQTPGRHATDVVLLPAYLVGALVSGNAHQASEVVTWVVAFGFVFGVVWLIEIVARKLSRAIARAKANG